MRKPSTIIAAVIGTFFVLGGMVAAASATPTTGQAATAVRHKVEHRFPEQTAEREVFARCRRITAHHHLQFSCLYGIHSDLEDATEGGSPWAYSGLAQVYPHGSSLTVELLGHLYRGGDFAP